MRSTMRLPGQAELDSQGCKRAPSALRRPTPNQDANGCGTLRAGRVFGEVSSNRSGASCASH
jgi:hypothetical protein